MKKVLSSALPKRGLHKRAFRRWHEIGKPCPYTKLPFTTFWYHSQKGVEQCKNCAKNFQLEKPPFQSQ